MIQKMDEFIIEQLDKAVQFVQDWLFISQKWIERGILVLFFLICVSDCVTLTLAHTGLTLEILADILVFSGMLLEHRETKVARTARRISGYMHRVGWIVISFGIALLQSIPVNESRYLILYGGLTILWCICRISMTYVTVLDVEGQKGKAAKLSWEKLKELFGTSWVPVPHPQEN